jgi:hypothetical protein
MTLMPCRPKELSLIGLGWHFAKVAQDHQGLILLGTHAEPCAPGPRSGISSRVHDVITGHAAKTTAEEYTKATVEDMAEALRKFPRYVV